MQSQIFRPVCISLNMREFMHDKSVRRGESKVLFVFIILNYFSVILYVEIVIFFHWLARAIGYTIVSESLKPQITKN